MKVYLDDIRDFEGWSGAEDIYDLIFNEGKIEDFDEFLTDMYPDGLSVTELNDLLRFDDDFVLNSLGIERE